MLNKRDINRNNLLKLLTENEEITVVFMKRTTNTVRTMHCTLHTNVVPFSFSGSIKKTIGEKTNLDILPVWDTIKHKWRSFYISTILSVDIPEAEDWEERAKLDVKDKKKKRS